MKLLHHNLFFFFFFTKSLESDILSSTAVKTSFVTKLLILSILHLTSFILRLRVSLVASLVISGILSSISVIFAL